MRVTDVTNADGIACANLITLISRARFDLSSGDADKLVEAKQWLHALATSMAGQLSPTAQAPAAPGKPDTSIRVRSMGTSKPVRASKKK